MTKPDLDPEGPFFLTEEIQAEMEANGYVFEPPDHYSTTVSLGMSASEAQVDTAKNSKIAPTAGGGRSGPEFGM